MIEFWRLPSLRDASVNTKRGERLQCELFHPVTKTNCKKSRADSEISIVYLSPHSEIWRAAKLRTHAGNQLLTETNIEKQKWFWQSICFRRSKNPNKGCFSFIGNMIKFPCFWGNNPVLVPSHKNVRPSLCATKVPKILGKKIGGHFSQPWWAFVLWKGCPMLRRFKIYTLAKGVAKVCGIYRWWRGCIHISIYMQHVFIFIDSFSNISNLPPSMTSPCQPLCKLHIASPAHRWGG